MPKGSPEERFWTKVDRAGPVPDYASHLGRCWLWMASKNWQGYGSFHAFGRTASAHRFAYELSVGPIPNGLHLDHLCRVRHCVNPAHLEPVTNAENSRRGQSPVAMQAHQTHCLRGHPFDEVNTRVRLGGHRQCRACENDLQNRRRANRTTRASRRAGWRPEEPAE